MFQLGEFLQIGQVYNHINYLMDRRVFAVMPAQAGIQA
jgi:hypothetical protein